MNLKLVIESIETKFNEALAGVVTLEQLEEVRVSVLGRSGTLTEEMKKIASLPIEEKKAIGPFINEAKKRMDEAFAGKERTINERMQKEREDSAQIDITIPGVRPELGHTHLTTQAIQEIVEIFSRLGFSRAKHPEIDFDFYAFESLNLPKEHAARDEWETFFVGENGKIATGAKGKIVLTPHTSNGQVREMEKKELPIRMLSIGKTYRRQAGVRHLPMFHQFEGLYIDKKATIPELMGVLNFFVKEFFGTGRTIRLRPYHFRFTEPSFEMDISAPAGEEGGKMYKDGWLELGGCGMVHPNVISSAGLDPNEYTGFAFGFGIERTMMMKSGINIDDIRTLYKNDLRFLKQF